MLRVVSVSRPESEGPPLPFVWFPYDLRCHWGLEAFKPWTVGSLDQVAGQCDSIGLKARPSPSFPI